MWGVKFRIYASGSKRVWGLGLKSVNNDPSPHEIKAVQGRNFVFLEVAASSVRSHAWTSGNFKTSTLNL